MRDEDNDEHWESKNLKRFNWIWSCESWK
jgi:hypothetical protein